MTIACAKKYAAQLFAFSSTPHLDAECILAHVLNVSRAQILAKPERALDAAQQKVFFKAAKKRARGVAVAYITGTKEFFGHEFRITPAVLVPKPDTEILVEKTLEAIIAYNGGSHPRAPKLRSACLCAAPPAGARTDMLSAPATPPPVLRVADVCTGSGCVALSLLLSAETPLCVTALDISRRALGIARLNAVNLLPSNKLDALTLVRSDLLAKPRGAQYDIIVANPPYIPRDQARELLADGRGEPLGALSGGKDGLEITGRLAAQAAQRLAPHGVLLLEIDERRAPAVQKILEANGFGGIIAHNDLSGMPRVVQACIS